MLDKIRWKTDVKCSTEALGLHLALEKTSASTLPRQDRKQLVIEAIINYMSVEEASDGW